jgi:signal transduction histidine kinase
MQHPTIRADGVRRTIRHQRHQRHRWPSSLSAEAMSAPPRMAALTLRGVRNDDIYKPGAGPQGGNFYLPFTLLRERFARVGVELHTADRVPVIQEHPHSVGFPENHPPMRSFLGVPIRTGDVQLGQIYLTEKKNAFEFTSDDEMIIQMLATYSATAIQNARFHESSQRLAILEERGRIGMDLHDGIIQSIYGVGLSLESALHSIKEDPKDANDRVKQAIDGLNQTIRDLRSYILDLRPRQMGMDGLLNGIKRLIAEYRANTFAEVSLIELDSDLGELTQPQSLALFHICQEALANAAKHAKAKKVQISLWTTQDRILMEINDDGMGFDVDSMSLTIGHGLANINTRARSSGGEADISSVLNAGTTILVWIPRLQHPPQ